MMALLSGFSKDATLLSLLATLAESPNLIQTKTTLLSTRRTTSRSSVTSLSTASRFISGSDRAPQTTSNPSNISSKRFKRWRRSTREEVMRASLSSTNTLNLSNSSHFSKELSREKCTQLSSIRTSCYRKYRGKVSKELYNFQKFSF